MKPKRKKKPQIPTPAKTPKRNKLESIPAPHAGQERFFSLPGRHRIAVCGRRFGKDVIAAILATDEARIGGKVLWIEPTDDQAQDAALEVWNYLEKNLITKDNPDGEWEYLATRKEFQHVSGGKIRFRSGLVGRGLRGRGWTLILLNEAADIPEEVWRRDLAPTLLTTHGRAVLLGTPRGKGNWLHKAFEAAARKTNWGRFQAPTRENPLLTLKELEEFREEMTEHEFREEFEAEFIDLENAVFPDIERHLCGEPISNGRPGAWYATGIDVGQSAFSVCISIDTETNRAKSLTRWNHTPWSISEARIRNHVKNFRGPALIDATGVGSGLAEDIEDIATAVLFTDEWRAKILKELAQAWEADKIKICADEQLTHELRCMVWHQDGTPPHVHLVARTTGTRTDCVMALALAWYIRRTKGDAPIPNSVRKAFLQMA